MTLIDTSAWIEALRKSGDPEVRERVRLLLINGNAAWCDMVRLELWNGASGKPETEMLRRLERDLPKLEVSEEVWKAACELANQARTAGVAGVTVPSTDLLIVACARHHKASIEHVDRHFDLLARL